MNILTGLALNNTCRIHESIVYKTANEMELDLPKGKIEINVTKLNKGIIS